MSYPTVNLNTPLEVQAPINVSSFKVLQVAENPQDHTVQAFIDFGAGTTWVSILNPNNYKVDWNDTDVTSAIQAWADSSFPPAR
jgi:hypothetical protein